MITRILMSLMAYLVMQISACELLRNLSPGNVLGGVEGCNFDYTFDDPIIFDIYVFNEPNGIPVAQVEWGANFQAAEYTIVGDSWWIKVWVGSFTHDLVRWVAELPPNGTYVWLPVDFAGTRDQMAECQQLLPYAETTAAEASLDIDLGEGLGCTYRPPEGFPRFPARVGPGYDRAIFLYLSSGEVGETLNITGWAFLRDEATSRELEWYRFGYGGRHLWASERDIGIAGPAYTEPEDCRLPGLPIPPVIPPAQDERIVFQDFEVYHCRHLGSNNFEWYSARVTYDGNGTPLFEEITGGPLTGQWREGCPAGEQILPAPLPVNTEPTLPGDPLPTDPPPLTEEPPTPTPTPTFCMCE
jgi:hypothetical protein